MNSLHQLFQQWSGKTPRSIQALAISGSNRQYYRITDADGHSYIGVQGTSTEENQAFIYLSRHFAQQQLPVPQVLAVSPDTMCYIQTDLGNRSLFDAIAGGRKSGGRYNQEEQQLLIRTIKELPNIQTRGAIGLDFNQCYPQAEFNTESVLFDLNYFKYCFLKATELDFNEIKLEANFRLMAKDLTSESYDTFLYRDFQARNIMLDERGNPYFIDFQGGRKGPFYYDLASFLWQASALYSDKLRRTLIYEYYNSLKQYIEVPSKRHFIHRLSLFVLFRTLQVLGAYGFRGYFERKPHFIQSIPPAIENLRQLLANGEQFFPYPYLITLLRKLCDLPRFAPHPTAIATQFTPDGAATVSQYDGKGALVVEVWSFSYRKGIPEDLSGNGGGYVFDCRATHNPGRYEPYKKLTGMDEPVIRFLEDDGEILHFLESVYSLADRHIERYMQRGFTHLMFSFGCTGGQHRSVYSAQHLAEYISRKYGIEVHLCHREQNIHQIFPPASHTNKDFGQHS